MRRQSQNATGAIWVLPTFSEAFLGARKQLFTYQKKTFRDKMKVQLDLDHAVA